MKPDSKSLPKLDKNIIFFGRLLRASGISIGSESIMEAIESVKLIKLKRSKEEFWFGNTKVCEKKRKT